jgi:uncharacterized protein YbbC (DUF1343 family)
MANVLTGLEIFLSDPPRGLASSNFALLAHQASVDSKLRHAKDLFFDRYPNNMKRLFSPQHGFRGEKQDNMIFSNHFTDPSTGMPVISIYGEQRRPEPDDLADLDLLIIDLQDVGTRVYTYIHTMAMTMQACKQADVRVIVLDRPNPIGGMAVEGNLLQPGFSSFVGLYPIPMRHGMTIGEMALLCNGQFGIGADLTVVPMKGWKRRMQFPETGLIFIPPSPNMPTWDTALVYPGQVIWEGTNVSEGRGTTRPFEWFGAPFFVAQQLKESFRKRNTPGVFMREIGFEPTFHKWAGLFCKGFHLHVTAPDLYEPYFSSLCLLQDVLRLWPESFSWKEPPYEYDYERLPIDLILGSSELREKITSGAEMKDIRREWAKGIEDFLDIRAPCLLYPEEG